MSQSYDLDANVQHLLATLEGPGKEEDAQPPEEEHVTIHVYPVAGGGILFSKVSLDQEEPTIVDSEEDPDTEIPLTEQPTTAAKEPPFFFSFLLILCFFVLFDLADSTLTALLTPTITVAITPKAHIISTTEALPIVSEGNTNGLQGRVLPEFTLTQSLRTQATGHGHQDARAAVGILTLYNGQALAQTIARGTRLTSVNGITVSLDQAVTIPPGNPPAYGQATMTAHALVPGSSGNMASGDIDTTIAIAVFVRNSQFRGGQDARDYPIVTQADIQKGTDTITPSLLQSARAALTSQLRAGEALAPPTCLPSASTDHRPGSEARTVQVTVSASCTAIAYEQEALQAQATAFLAHVAATQVGTGYRLAGSLQVTVKQATITQTAAVVSLSLLGTWVYTFSQEEQQQIKQRMRGRTKQDALQQLLSQPGIDKATIAGIGENEVLPDDITHIHLFLMVEE